MKFKAYIPYHFMLIRESKIMHGEIKTGTEIEFTFQDIVGHLAQVNGKEIFISPLFTARELIIPWLQKGNIPELKEE